MGNFLIADGGAINLCVLTPDPSIRDTFEHLGLAGAADDPRFSDVWSLFANCEAASDLIVEAFAKQPFAYRREHLKTMKASGRRCRACLT